jgi:uncharacterized protein with FMN-binding domain
MRRALAALVVTAAAVVWLVRYETRPPRSFNPESALAARRPASHQRGRDAPKRSGVAPGTPGTHTAAGPVDQTPFTVIQVQATLRGRRLVGVQTLELAGNDPHTEALNARAEPILRAEALRAGSARVDAVSGATYTSRSWRRSLQQAIDAARSRPGATG